MDETQLLKGILEGCVLSMISRGETYGYHIITTLEQHGFIDIQEGTLYPVLARLEKKGDIICRVGKSPYGPKRKYYSITEDGSRHLQEFLENYDKIIHIANHILQEGLRGGK